MSTQPREQAPDGYLVAYGALRLLQWACSIVRCISVIIRVKWKSVNGQGEGETIEKCNADSCKKRMSRIYFKI